MKWFRFPNDFINEIRIGRLPDWQQLVLIKLMCIECRGDLDPEYSEGFEQDLADYLRITDEQWIEVRNLFIEKKLIERHKNGFKVIYGEGVVGGNDRPPAHEWRRLRSLVFERDNYTCSYCGERGVMLECDHIIPISRGGGNSISNLTTACKPCNLSKRDRTPDEWLGGKSNG